MKTAVSQKMLVQRKKAKKLQGLKRLKVAALSILIVVACAFSYRFYNSPEFSLKSVLVTGNSRVKKQEIIAAAALSRDDLLTKISSNVLSQKISNKNHWIESVRIKKNWPSAICLKVVEREPGARIRIGKSDWLIDWRGVLLGSTLLKKDRFLPMLMQSFRIDRPTEGARINTRESANAFKALKLLPQDLRDRVKIIRAGTVSGLSFEMQKGTKIYFGEARLCGAKNLIIRRMIENAELRGELLDYLDVRVPSRPAYKVRQG